MGNDREQQFKFILRERPEGMIADMTTAAADGWRLIGAPIQFAGKLLAFLQRDKPSGDEVF